MRRMRNVRVHLTYEATISIQVHETASDHDVALLGESLIDASDLSLTDYKITAAGAKDVLANV